MPPKPKRKSPGLAQAAAAALSISKRTLYAMLARPGGSELVALRLKNQAVAKKITVFKIFYSRAPRVVATISVRTLALARTFGEKP
jgi:hypothetical protein